MQGGPETGRHPEGRKMEDEFVVIVRRFNANGAPYLLNVKAYPSPEEAAGAAGAHMRTDGLPKGQVIDRIVTMLDLNIGAVHLVRDLNSTYRIIHAHRLGDGTLVAPGLLVRTAASRFGRILTGQFEGVSSARTTDGPGWIGGREGWLYVKWDDGKSERPHGHDQVRVGDLFSLGAR